MRWLWFVFALGSFAVAFRTHSMGLAVLCLLAALGFVLMGTLALASRRIESRGRDASTMLGSEDLRRMREQIERRKREDEGIAAGGAGVRRRDDSDTDNDSVGGASGGGAG